MFVLIKRIQERDCRVEWIRGGLGSLRVDPGGDRSVVIIENPKKDCWIIRGLYDGVQISTHTVKSEDEAFSAFEELIEPLARLEVRRWLRFMCLPFILLALLKILVDDIWP